MRKRPHPNRQRDRQTDRLLIPIEGSARKIDISNNAEVLLLDRLSKQIFKKNCNCNCIIFPAGGVFAPIMTLLYVCVG